MNKGKIYQQAILMLLLISHNKAREIARLDELAEEPSIAVETASKATIDKASLIMQRDPLQTIDEQLKEVANENTITEKLKQKQDAVKESNENIDLEGIAEEASSRVQSAVNANEEEAQSAFSAREQNQLADETALPSQEEPAEYNTAKQTESQESLNDEIREAPTENDELLSTSTASPSADASGQDKQFAGVIEAIVSIFLPTTTRPITTTTTQAPQRECPDCECGRINTYRKIVGGENTEVNEYPWMTLLRQNGRFFCGGSVINDLYVLTAAHCVVGLLPTQLTMRILQYQRETQSMTTIERRAAAIQINERYNPRTYDNDIALIRLREPLEFDDLLRPVCLPEEGNTYADDDAIVTGWGATSEGGPLADVLQEVRVPIFSNERCRMTSYSSGQITDNMLCAGNLTGGMDSCQGDSGGPLHVNSNSVYEQPGIVSWGNGCARPDTPGVYTRVTRYLSWIGNRTRDGCYCDRDDEETADKRTTQKTLLLDLKI